MNKTSNNCNIQIIYFDGRMSKWLASLLSRIFVQNHYSINSDIFGDINSIYAEHVFFIFPILGENRFPKVVETFLESINNKCLAHCHLILSCDIDPENNAHYAVAFKFIQHMQNLGIHSFSPPLIIDNPINISEKEIVQWAMNSIEKSPHKSHGIDLQPKSLQLDMDSLIIQLEKFREWHMLCNLLGRKPLIEPAKFSQDGIALSLITDEFYPQSLLRQLTPEKTDKLWLYLNNLTIVTELSLPYAKLQIWPSDLDNLENRLKSLNIIMNEFESFDFLSRCKNLVSLNIAANNLTQLPTSIGNLKNLHTLLVYKNLISDIPNFLVNMPNLYKLSLYRNFLKTIPAWFNRMLSLRHLNLGGNPIEYLPKELTEIQLEFLGLRNCGFTKIPAVLKDLNVIAVDLTKNPKLRSQNRNFVTNL